MKFKLAKSTQKTSDQPKREVDFEAMQAEIIATAKTEKKARSIPGVITGVVDLGIQKRPDAEEEFKGTEEDEAKEIASNPAVYFEDKIKNGKTIRVKRRPQRDCQQVAITVDFPQIVVDKAKYFTGESNPAPLRLILNGENSLWMTTRKEEDKKVRVMQKGYSLTESKHPNGKWGFDKKATLWKLADAVGIVDEEGIFKAEDILQLIGKVAQFEIRVYMKENKGKKYYTEEIALVGMVPEGITLPEVDENLLFCIMLDDENEQDHLKNLRVSMINTIKRASNFEGSILQKQLGAKGSTDQPSQPAAETPAEEGEEDSPF